MPKSQAPKSAPSNPTRAELESECAAQLRNIGDRLDSWGSAAEITAWVLAEMPGKKARRNGAVSPPPRLPAELEVECIQLRRIGDKLNLRQKLLNLVSKLFNLIT